MFVKTKLQTLQKKFPLNKMHLSLTLVKTIWHTKAVTSRNINFPTCSVL